MIRSRQHVAGGQFKISMSFLLEDNLVKSISPSSQLTLPCFPLAESSSQISEFSAIIDVFSVSENWKIGEVEAKNLIFTHFYLI